MTAGASRSSASGVLRLGPFELDAPMARGGMAEVWRGRHVDEGVPVAVKVLTAGFAREPEYRAAFRTEVRAVAWLDHPGIVVVLDHGEVPAETAARSHGHLTAASPYLVMELATLGTLRRLRAPLRWSELRVVILSLLDACAHAHARGVIHRDIKPGNVLVAAHDAQVRLKLTDFGIAHLETFAPTATPQSLRAFGTPGYMAPEQLRGAWREIGAWTDLYALGCLTYVLACGRAPFGGNAEEAAEAQLLATTPPPFEPVHPCPPELGAWVGRMLEREPERRFERAADAAWALPRERGRPLAEHDDDRELKASVPFWVELLAAERRRSLPTGVVTPSSPPATGSSDGTLTVPFHALADLSDHDAPVRTTVPPLPATWRRASAPPAPMRLVGAGLRLLPLRTIPMVGRRAERDRLWALLREVTAERRPRAAVVSGPAGVGKSRLAEWIAERAHEVGGASILRATHGPTADPSDGLARMWLAYLRGYGLPSERLAERAERALRRLGARDRAEWRGLTDLVTGARFETAAERFLAVERVLARMATRRPVLVWLDDVQWGSEAIELTQHVLEVPTTRSMPVLFVLTVQDEALAEHPRERASLDVVRAHDGSASLAIGALREPELSSLVSDLLRLEPRLAARIVARARGNPLFAVQLVGDWVQRGALRVGAVGFELATDQEHAHVPDDLYAVWGARVDRMLATRSAHDAVALELAAILGHEVNRTEWRDVCREAGVMPHDALEDALVESRFVVPAEGGFSFVHGMLRESLERMARDRGRLERDHAAIAGSLAKRRAGGELRVSERLGRHRLAAGDPAGAWPSLMEGAELRRERCDYVGAHDALDLASRALEQLGAGEDDPRWGDVWLARAWVCRLLAAYDDAQRFAQMAFDAARAHGWSALEAEAESRIGEVLLRRGLVREAKERIERAMLGLMHEGRFAGVARARWTLGWVCILRGETARAIDLFESVLRVTEQLKASPSATLHAMWSLGHALAKHGDLDRAKEVHERALAGAIEHQNLLAEAHAHHGLMTIARMRRDLEGAERHAREALTRFVAIGSGETYAPRYGLGLAYLAADRFDDARTELERGLMEVSAAGRSGLETLFVVALLPCAVRDAAPTELDAMITRAESAIARSGIADPDLVVVLDRVCATLDERRDVERAAQMRAIAASLRPTTPTDEAP